MDLAEISAAAVVGAYSDVAAMYYTAIVQSSDDAIISKSLDGIIISWNPGAEAMFGYSAAEMIGHPILVLLPLDRQDEERFILEQIRSGQKVDHFESVRVRKDGSLINVSVTISPVYDASGVILGASKIARDITQRKQAEMRLHLAASVFTYSSEGIIITDAKGVIIDVNAAFTRITGFGIDEVVGRTADFFASSRHGPAFYAAIGVTLARDDHWQGEIWSRRKDGEAYAGLLTISAVRNSEGQTQSHVALFCDITPLRKQQEALEYLAHYDMLTRLPNRLLLSDRLQQAMIQSERNGESLAVLYLDLDGFKAINDAWGHDVGDELLIAIAQRMKLALRECDTLGRFGGDEFVGVLTGLHRPEDCEPMLLRLLEAAAAPVQIGQLVLQVSASIGVTIFPQDGVSADHLLRHADQAMYQAKQAGRNRHQLFDVGLDRAVKNRSEGVEHVQQALARNEFVLHYQPKVNMKTGQLVGAEALIRWQHPQLGLLPPAAFLPMIEDHLVSVPLGEWVIRTALDQMAEWRAVGLDIPVSVNVGSRQLQDDDFVLWLSGVLAAHPDFKPDSLELEILETRALDDMTRISGVMRACSQIGVRFALDDFGTGYSTLTYLKRLPAATLKIDQSFILGMLDDSDDLAIVEGVIGLALAFHRDLVAEGVETVAHGELLLALGCDYAQGYGIARPMPAAAIPDWSATWRPDPAWTGWQDHVPDRNDLSLAFVEVELRQWLRDIDAYLHGKNSASQIGPCLHRADNPAGDGRESMVRAHFGSMPAFLGVLEMDDRFLLLMQKLVAAQDAGQPEVARDYLAQLHAQRDALVALLRQLVRGN